MFDRFFKPPEETFIQRIEREEREWIAAGFAQMEGYLAYFIEEDLTGDDIRGLA